MLRSRVGGIDIHGGRDYLWYDPGETGINAVAIGVGNEAVGRAIYVGGFGHFQIHVTQTVASALDVAFSPCYADGTLYGGRYLIATIAAGGPLSETFYWGTNSPATRMGGFPGNWRFGRYIVPNIKCTAGAVTTVTVRIECMT